MEDDNEFFTSDRSFTGPPISEWDLERAEAELGFWLPDAYKLLVLEQNGGVPRKRRVPTEFRTSWADDHMAILAIKGVDGEWGINSTSGLGSRDAIAEWGYPDIGIVICETPSGGHDTVMLDYCHYETSKEPVVAYIDEDRIPRKIAESMQDFLDRLY